jgi:peptidoglycan/xylan/chitin deacetylase (PgdA/CDA1 family)
MTIVLWSVDTRDWAHTPIEEMCCNIRENVRNGSIILMHDFIGKNSPTPNALRLIIPMLSELGYEMVTVSELLGEAE